MNSSAPQTDIDDARVDTAVAEYFRRVDDGLQVDQEAFIRQFPEVADALRDFFDASRLIEQFAGPVAYEAGNPSLGQDTSRLASESGTHRDYLRAATPRPIKRPVLTLPAQLGRYEIQNLLGEGSMGSVYLAFDTDLNRHVALKIPKLDEPDDAELKQRFRREARSAATLRSPNICPLYDVSEVDGILFITMAYIDGRPLAQMIRHGGPLPQAASALLVRKLALALQKAHEQGIVHRDVKPGNIMIDRDGEPILTDFGLARDIRSQEPRITRAGTIIGSPAYMAPEQLSGAAVSPAADQYGLGVVLYEMLAGQLPFQGDIWSILAQIATQEPPTPSRIGTDIDSELESICLKMMSKQADHRFSNMAAVAEALDRYLNRIGAARIGGLPSGDSSPADFSATPSLAPRHRSDSSRKSSLNKPAVALTLLGGVALGSAIMLYNYWSTSDATPIAKRNDAPAVTPSPTWPPLAPDEIRRFAGHTEPVSALSLAVGANRLVSGDEGGWLRVWDVITGRQLHKIAAHRGRVACTDVSPNAGKALSCGHDQAIRLWDLETGRLTRQYAGHEQEVMCVALAPDGTRFCSGGRDARVMVWDINQPIPVAVLGYSRGDRVPVIEKMDDLEQLEGHVTWVRTAVFSQDGKRILSGGNDGLIAIWDLERKAIVNHLIGHRAPVSRAVWTGDGRRVVSAGYDNSVRLWDTETGELLHTFDEHAGPVLDVDVSADGRFAYSCSSDASVRVWDLEARSCIAIYKGHTNAVSAVAVDLKQSNLFSGGEDTTIRMWRSRNVE
jgi:serine/threonine protein kinase